MDQGHPRFEFWNALYGDAARRMEIVAQVEEVGGGSAAAGA